MLDFKFYKFDPIFHLLQDVFDTFLVLLEGLAFIEFEDWARTVEEFKGIGENQGEFFFGEGGGEVIGIGGEEGVERVAIEVGGEGKIEKGASIEPLEV